VDRWAVLDVQDQGVGIAQDRLIRIFDYLDQGGLPVRNGGFGIGLWVVRHLATAMGGDVSVESQLNRGSTFTLKVPITPKEDRG
jgi:signal transduction histidine kinase